MKIFFHVKEVTSSFMNPLKSYLLGIHSVISQPSLLSHHASDTHMLVSGFICFISGHLQSQTFLLTTEHPHVIFPLPGYLSSTQFFTWLTHLFFWYKGLFSKETVSTPSGTSEFPCYLLFYTIPCFSCVAFITIVFK